MSYLASTVPDMNDAGELEIIVTITGQDGALPHPDRFTTAARHAASKTAVVKEPMFIWPAGKLITSMTIAGVSDEASAVTAVLGVITEALQNLREGTGIGQTAVPHPA